MRLTADLVRRVKALGPLPAGGELARVDLAELLGRLVGFLRRYVVFREEQADAVALWVAEAWALDAFDYSPYLAVVSAEKRAGKSRLLEVLELIVPRPWRVVTPTEAVTFRKVARDCPTMLLDEVDAIFGASAGNHEGLRAILNAGNTRGVRVPRCAGPNRDRLEEFEVFCPKALAGIGNPPSTVLDRSIRIELKRKAPGERVERFRLREAREVAELARAELAAWAQASVALLREARPALPDELDDRAADGWEPLLAIADLAGGEWPERARRAALALSTGEGREDESLGVRLLADVRRVFEEHGCDRIASVELIERLAEDEEAPWADWRGRGRITPRALAGILARYSVRSKTIWLAGGSTAKGFLREQFEDAFARYLAPNPSGPSGSAPQAGLSPFFDSSGDPGLTDRRGAANPHEQRNLTDLTDRKRDQGEVA